MKKLFYALVFTVVLGLICTSQVLADDGITVKLNGETIQFDVQPTIINGSTMVPVRAIFEALDATVEWDDKTKTVIATKDETTVKITIDSKFMYVDGNKVELYMPARIIGGRTLVPVRAISEAFYCTVAWDGKAKLVSIYDDYINWTTLYAPGGRSRAVLCKETCAYLSVGWFWDSDLTDNTQHIWKDSNCICKYCGKVAGSKVDMTNEEKKMASQVEYISNREFWHDDSIGAYILTFTLTDKTQTKELAVPARVGIQIVNDNGENLYDESTYVFSFDYGYWTKNLTGATTYRCAVYIYDFQISAGTIESGYVTFNVDNEGNFYFDPYKMRINYDLPLLETEIDLPILPKTISEYSWDDNVLTTCKITEISYEVDEYNDLTLYFSGEKIYDEKGNNYSRSTKVGWKLYDEEGYIVESGTFYSPNISVGEKFRNETSMGYDCVTPGKKYTLKISSVD